MCYLLLKYVMTTMSVKINRIGSPSSSHGPSAFLGHSMACPCARVVPKDGIAWWHSSTNPLCADDIADAGAELRNIFRFYDQL